VAGGQARHRTGRRRPNGGLLVPGHLKDGQPVVCSELGEVASDAALRLVGQVGGSDPQRQRQVGAPLGQRGGRVRLGVDPRLAKEPRQQGVGLLGGEHVQGEPPGAFLGHQSTQPVAAGDQHQAAEAAREQRANLVGAASVVEQHQYALAGQQRAVHARRLLHLDRGLLGGHTKRVQEPGERVDRSDRRRRRVAAQVDVQLPVGKPLADPVGPMDGQGGLADPGGPGDRRDHHRGGVYARLPQLVQLVELVVAAGEGRHIGGQLRRWGPHGCRHRGSCCCIGTRARHPAARRSGSRQLLAQDAQMRVLEFGARLDPQFVGKPTPQVSEQP
jgi:hypothetical protein